MNFFSSLGATAIAIIVLLILIVGGWFYVDHLNGKIKTLQAQGEQAAIVSKNNEETVKKVIEDATRQGNILTRQRDEALAKATKMQQRYQQIMEVAHDQDSFVSPVLCDSLVRLYEFTPATSGGPLQLQPTGSPVKTSSLAKSACGKITQKDVAAWLETQVYPAFKLMQQNFVDLQQYVGE
jgi:hypothetical protein